MNKVYRITIAFYTQKFIYRWFLELIDLEVQHFNDSPELILLYFNFVRELGGIRVDMEELSKSMGTLSYVLSDSLKDTKHKMSWIFNCFVISELLKSRTKFWVSDFSWVVVIKFLENLVEIIFWQIRVPAFLNSLTKFLPVKSHVIVFVEFLKNFQNISLTLDHDFLLNLLKDVI